MSLLLACLLACHSNGRVSSQANINAAIKKKGLVSGYVDEAVRKRFDAGFWKARWKSLKCGAPS